MEELTIIPVKVGGFKAVPKTVYTYFLDFDKQLDSAIIMYVIKGRDKLILVDTGGGDEEWCKKYHRVISRPPEEVPAAALKKLGIAVEDIEIVVNTHLHWDHCFNNELFSKARIYVQKRELQCAIDPLPTQAEMYEAYQVGMTPQWFNSYNRMIPVDGDTELCPGIELVTIPGHTPGMQGVVVNTAGGRYLIASDTLGLFENWQGKGRYKHIPSGIHYDLVEYHKTFEKIEKICDHILPGHDPLVFQHKQYPS